MHNLQRRGKDKQPRFLVQPLCEQDDVDITARAAADLAEEEGSSSDTECNTQNTYSFVDERHRV